MGQGNNKLPKQEVNGEISNFEALGVININGIEFKVGYRFNHISGGGFKRCLKIYRSTNSNLDEKTYFNGDKFPVDSVSIPEDKIRIGDYLSLNLIEPPGETERDDTKETITMLIEQII